MIRRILITIALLALPSLARANEAFHGWCELGNQSVVTQGLSSTTKVQQSNPQCTVTVFVHGGALATLFADNNGTPLANPFQSQTNGQIIFYAANGRYDIRMSPGTTYLDWLLCDPVTGGGCGPGSGVTWYLNNSLVGVEPAYDVIPGTNITITATDDPTNTRVHYTINASGGGAGCTLTGVNTGIVSEHPLGVCFDNSDATWDDTNTNLQFGDGSSTFTGTNTFTYTHGVHNALTDLTGSNTDGDHNTLTCDSNTIGLNTCGRFFTLGSRNGHSITDAGSAGEFVWTLADSAGIGITGDSNVAYMMLLMDGDTAVAGSGGHLDHIFSAGKVNSVSSTGTGSLNSSITSSIFQLGETLSAISTAGGNMEDAIQLGENDTMRADNASSVAGLSTQVGFNHVFTSNGGHGMSYGFAEGHNNAATSTGAAMAEFGMIGHSHQETDCSHCYLIGENGIWGSSDSSKIGIGFSNAMEEVITAGHVALNAHLDQTAAGKFGNKCSMSASTTCTFSIAAAFTGTPLCVTSIDAASSVPATANVAKCSVSGTTVTITAGSSNSLTWDAILLGNPN